MRIEINEDEIVLAIIAYVGAQGIAIDPTHAEVDLKAGRGENGMTATISIARSRPFRRWLIFQTCTIRPTLRTGSISSSELA